MSVQYPTRDTKYPPNETLAARRLWELATRPEDGVIPAGTLFVERWSNGHYGPPETNSFELLTTDNIGPGFTCERRVLVPADPHRPLTADDITDEMVERGNQAWSALRSPENTFPRLIVETIIRAALAPPTEDPEVVALAEVLGDFAIADEHSGDRDDMILARRLHERGVRVTGVPND